MRNNHEPGYNPPPRPPASFRFSPDISSKNHEPGYNPPPSPQRPPEPYLLPPILPSPPGVSWLPPLHDILPNHHHESGYNPPTAASGTGVDHQGQGPNTENAAAQHAQPTKDDGRPTGSGSRRKKPVSRLPSRLRPANNPAASGTGVDHQGQGPNTGNAAAQHAQRKVEFLHYDGASTISKPPSTSRHKDAVFSPQLPMPENNPAAQHAQPTDDNFLQYDGASSNPEYSSTIRYKDAVFSPQFPMPANNPASSGTGVDHQGQGPNTENAAAQHAQPTKDDGRSTGSGPRRTKPVSRLPSRLRPANNPAASGTGVDHQGQGPNTGTAAAQP